MIIRGESEGELLINDWVTPALLMLTAYATFTAIYVELPDWSFKSQYNGCTCACM